MFSRTLIRRWGCWRTAIGVALLLRVTTSPVGAYEKHEITAQLQPNKGVGVAFGELSRGHVWNSVKVILNAPEDYLIGESRLREMSGSVWVRCEQHTDSQDAHEYEVVGTRAHEIHAVGFEGTLVRHAPGPGDPPPVDVSLADINMAVDSQALWSDGITGHWPPDKSAIEDERKKGEGGGIHLPPNMYNSTGWPTTLGQDYKILLVNIRPKWKALSDNDPLPLDSRATPYVGTLTFEYSMPGLAIYWIGGQRIQSGQTIPVPPDGFTDVEFGLLTNADFGFTTESGTITATFTWNSDIAGSPASAVDRVRVSTLTSFVVNSVTFGLAEGYQQTLIRHDQGDVYPTFLLPPLGDPHWRRGAVTQYPACYVRESKMKLDVEFLSSTFYEGEEVPFCGIGGDDFKGDGDESLEFDARLEEVSSNNKVVLVNWECNAKFKNQVDIADPLAIDWYFMRPGETVWTSAGRSENQVYLTYAVPDHATMVFHTPLHIGCTKAKGQTEASQCVEAIWSEFTDRIVDRLDGTQMTYWGPQALSEPLMGTGDLLYHGDGRCNAWANFFADILKTQGIISANIRGIVTTDIDEGSGDGFEVKASIPGQGNPHPLNRFHDGHAVVTIGTTIYDPSYGERYDSLLEWEDAVIERLWYKNGEVSLPRDNIPGVLQTKWSQ